MDLVANFDKQDMFVTNLFLEVEIINIKQTGKLHIILDSEKFEWYDSEIDEFFSYTKKGLLPSDIAEEMKVSVMSIGILVLWLKEKGRL